VPWLFLLLLRSLPVTIFSDVLSFLAGGLSVSNSDSDPKSLLAVPFLLGALVMATFEWHSACVQRDDARARVVELEARITVATSDADRIVEEINDVLPADEQSESADQPTLTEGAVGSASSEAHADPRWHAFRRDWVAKHPCCQWKGCQECGSGLNVHHVIPMRWCALAGHPDMCWSEVHGQRFLTLCREHHELAHSIGHGGSWDRFNPDAVHDAQAGRWNSRGRSTWFKSDEEAIEWIKKQGAK